MRTMQVHRAPTPLGGPLKLQVRSQYLSSDPREKVWKVPGTWPADWSDLLSTDWSHLVSIAPCCYDAQYNKVRKGEASCTESQVGVIYGMASKRKNSSRGLDGLLWEWAGISCVMCASIEKIQNFRLKLENCLNWSGQLDISLNDTYSDMD